MYTESEDRMEAVERTWRYYEYHKIAPPDIYSEEWKDMFYQNLHDIEEGR